MAVETFTYLRQAGATGTIDYRVRELQFGDGYMQSVADGINNKTQTWPLSFEGGMTDIQPIIDFLDRHKGYKSFFWTPPGTSTPLLFRATKASLTSKGAGVYGLSVEFKQVFNY
jgi:phage-related protein